MTPRHALDAAINAVAAIEDNLSTSYSDAILSALAAEGWMLMDVCRNPWHDNNEPVDGPCPKCGEGVTLTREPGLREALDTIREICKPMSMTMQGPRWMSGESDVFGGGNRERVWRIADAALASEDRP